MSDTMEKTRALIDSHMLVLSSIPGEIAGHVAEIDAVIIEINMLKAKIAERYREIWRHEKELDALDVMQKTVTRELADLYASSISSAKEGYTKDGRYVTVLDLEKMICEQA